MENARKPAAAQSAADPRGIPAPKAGGPRRWAFSFRFWRQIEFFGLDRAKPAWFVSLLERLSELSKLPIDEFRSDVAARKYHRYHLIDWDQTNIPVRREDLDWVDREYIDNPEEYPLAQFMISLALGRVVGFWDEQDVFNIVLLDPLHNLQPSRSHNYRVDPCSPLSCEYSSLLLEVDEIKGLRCVAPGCPVKAALDGVGTLGGRREVMVIPVPEGTGEWVTSLLAAHRAESVADILEVGILTLDTEQVRKQEAGEA